MVTLDHLNKEQDPILEERKLKNSHKDPPLLFQIINIKIRFKSERDEDELL